MPIPFYMDEHIPKAITLGLRLRDDDLLSEAAHRQKAGKSFCGVIYAHPLNISIGKCISDLHVIGQAGEPEDMENRVEFLPLRQ